MLVTQEQIRGYLESANQHERHRLNLDSFRPSMTPLLDKQLDNIVERLPRQKRNQLPNTRPLSSVRRQKSLDRLNYYVPEKQKSKTKKHR